MLIGEHLHLDVTRIDDGFFDIHLAIAEGTLRFALRRLECGLELLGTIHQSHALATASGRGFEHHGIADLPSYLHGFFRRVQAPRGSRYERNSGALHMLARPSL